MSTSGDDWARLAAALAARSEELGATQAQISANGGPSPSIVSDLLAGKRTNYAKNTPRKIDAGWQWVPGSARRVLRGGDPEPLPVALAGAALSGSGTLAASGAVAGSGHRLPDDERMDATLVAPRFEARLDAPVGRVVEAALHFAGWRAEEIAPVLAKLDEIAARRQ